MSYDVIITRQSISALFDIKGTAQAVEKELGNVLPMLPDRPNSLTRDGALALMFIGRDHWILRAPIDQEAKLIAALKPGEAAEALSIVQVSDTLTFFSVTGSQADDIMAIASSLDLRPSRFGEDKVTYSEVFGLQSLVQRVEGGFEFAVDQSFSDFVADYLNRIVG